MNNESFESVNNNDGGASQLTTDQIINQLTEKVALLCSSESYFSGDTRPLELELLQFATTHRGIPAVNDCLISLIVKLECVKVQEILETCLRDFAAERLASALKLKELLQRLSQYQGEDVAIWNEYQQKLVAFVDDPALVDCLIDLLMTRNNGAYYVAHALRESSLVEKQAKLRELVIDSLQSEFSYFQRDQRWTLPFALDPNLPETAKVLQKVVTAEKSHIRNFETSAVHSLAEVSSEYALPILKQVYFVPSAEWNFQRACAGAMQAHLTAEVEEELIQFLDCSLIESAWFLAGKQELTGFRRTLFTLSLLRERSQVLHDKRVQAALTLIDVQPAQAKSVLEKVAVSKLQHKYKCHFFAACDAEIALGV